MHYFIFPLKDSSIYADRPTQNAGIDQIIELWKEVVTSTEIPYNSRILMQFDLSDYSQSFASGELSGSDMKFYLNLYTDEATEIPLSYTIYAYPVSQSWEMGTGKRGNWPITETGVSWNLRDGITVAGVSGSAWNSTGGDFITSSLSGSAYNLVATQSFEFQTTDLHMDITDIVMSWLTGEIPNYGLILKRSDADETSSLNQGNIQFFSNETHTIYRPRLEVIWKDFSFAPYSSSISASYTEVTASDNWATATETASYATSSFVTASLNADYFTQSGDISTWYSESYFFNTASIWTYTGSSGLFSSHSFTETTQATASYVYTSGSDTEVSTSITQKLTTFTNFYTASLGSEYKLARDIDSSGSISTVTFHTESGLTEIQNTNPDGYLFHGYETVGPDRVYRRVYDANGTLVSSSFFPLGNAYASASLTTISESNVYMAGGADIGGFLIPTDWVFDSTGSFITGSSDLSGLLITGGTDVVHLSNGNVFVTFGGFQGFSYFPIVGNFMSSSNYGAVDYQNEYEQNNYAVGGKFSAVQLSNTNLMIFYQNATFSGSLLIIDVTGSVVSSGSAYHTSSTGDQKAIVLNSGNVFVTYEDKSNSSYPTFQVLDNNGSIVTNKTVIDTVATDKVVPVQLSDNNIFVSYTDKTNSQGAFKVLNSAGTDLTGRNTFYSSDVRDFDTTLLASDRVFISFIDNTTSSGSFNGWQFDIGTLYFSSASVTSSDIWSYSTTTGVYSSQSFETRLFTYTSSSISSYATSSASVNTGRASVMTTEDMVLYLTNLKPEYRQNSKVRFRIATRERYPVKNYVTESWAYTREMRYLPTQSYYSIRDAWTEEEVIPFSDYSQISVDYTGSFFDLYLNGIEPERIYRILFKVSQSNLETIYDKDYSFKVVR